jgi:4'-phosphopantetheinyl transferase
MTGEALRDRFFALWTLKEALVKATGAGLSLPLDKFAFEIEGGAIRVAFQGRDDTTAWQFALWRTTTDHVVAAAVRHDGAGVRPLGLQVRRTVPLGQDLTDAGITCIASSGARHSGQGP